MTSPDSSAAGAAIPAAEGPTDDQRAVFRIGEWDWWETTAGRALHASVAVEPDPAYETSGPGRTLCGVHSWLSIPGVFTRMGAPRCGRCCDAIGYPRGKGSPKNDPAIRPLVEARIAERGL